MQHASGELLWNQMGVFSSDTLTSLKCRWSGKRGGEQPQGTVPRGLVPATGRGDRCIGGRMAECSENRRKGEEGLSLRQRDHSATWQNGVAECPPPFFPAPTAQLQW